MCMIRYGLDKRRGVYIIFKTKGKDRDWFFEFYQREKKLLEGSIKKLIVDIRPLIKKQFNTKKQTLPTFSHLAVKLTSVGDWVFGIKFGKKPRVIFGKKTTKGRRYLYLKPETFISILCLAKGIRLESYDTGKRRDRHIRHSKDWKNRTVHQKIKGK